MGKPKIKVTKNQDVWTCQKQGYVNDQKNMMKVAPTKSSKSPNMPGWCLKQTQGSRRLQMAATTPSAKVPDHKPSAKVPDHKKPDVKKPATSAVAVPKCEDKRLRRRRMQAVAAPARSQIQHFCPLVKAPTTYYQCYRC